MNKGLCFRCEYRAQFLENDRRARYECGEIESSVFGCYMFKPVRPITIKPRNGDPRPLALGLLSCRVERVEEDPDLILTSLINDEGILVYWEPNKKEEDV